MYYTYVLRSLKDGGLYIGYTGNLADRLRQHRWGKVKSTRGRRPLILVYWEELSCLEEARERELYLKTSPGRRYIRRIIESRDKKGQGLMIED
jgi:putative endonuclease